MKKLVLSLWLIFISGVSIGQNWEEVTSKNPNIKLFIDNDDIDDGYHIKAICNIPKNIAKIEEKIESPTNYPDWLYRYKEAEKINATKNGFVFRAIINAPTPLKNRKIRVAVDKKRNATNTDYILTSSAFEDATYCPNCNTVENLKGAWYLKSLSDNLTKVTHEMYMDIKIPLPRSLVYRLMLKGPTKSFENLLKH